MNGILIVHGNEKVKERKKMYFLTILAFKKSLLFLIWLSCRFLLLLLLILLRNHTKLLKVFYIENIMLTFM